MALGGNQSTVSLEKIESDKIWIAYIANMDRDVNYWNQYYLRKEKEIQEPSDFAKFVLPYMETHKKLWILVAEMVETVSIFHKMD